MSYLIEDALMNLLIQEGIMKIKESIEILGIKTEEKVYRNIPVPKLVRKVLQKKDGVLTDSGALAVATGRYTGRSPKDRFIVIDEMRDTTINWSDSNQRIDEPTYTKLYDRVIGYLANKELYVFDGFVGAMDKYRVPIRVVNEQAVNAIFSNQLFIRPTKKELDDFEPEYTIITAPKFKGNAEKDGINSEAFVILNLKEKIILVAGSEYNGEIKKAMFSVMNYIMPEKGVLPMHCSANMSNDGSTVLFFGLSGTGKTTLSADSNRRLIGDDEHGWSDEGVFNFEGGCYAKTIGLKRENEEDIFDALKFGALLENVVVDPDKKPDYDSNKYTENCRGAYPINFIKNAELSGQGGQPNTIIFLTADAFGVIPPISKLSKEGAMFHFMSGYTSKLAGTERGITEPVATFSACFGEPFMLRSPYEYAKLLGERIHKGEVDVYLVNTGWLYGGYTNGSRIKLKLTRAMVNAAIEGKLKDVEYETHEIFNLSIPKDVPGVPSEILRPENTWEDKEDYMRAAIELAERFNENFKKYINVPMKVRDAGPKVPESLHFI